LLCSAGANPFDEDEEEEDFSNVVGVPVLALYDYAGQEDDELSFKQGALLIQNFTMKFSYISHSSVYIHRFYHLISYFHILSII